MFKWPWRKKSLSEQGYDLLVKLGKTADDKAAKLLALGYKGVRYNAKECPCGSYLRDKLETDQVRVYHERVEVGEIYSKDKSVFSFPKKNEVSMFVDNFDTGQYPELYKD